MKNYDVVVIGAGNGGLSAALWLAKHGKSVLVLEKHNLPGGCTTSFVRGAYEFEATLHEMCQMGDGKNGTPRGAVRKLLEDEYQLDVDWVPVEEAFAAIATDEDGFDVAMPLGVEAFLDEMEKHVPGSRPSMTTVMELGKMLVDGVDWLAEHDNEPGALAKVEMLLKYHDLMKVVPMSTEEMLVKIGVPKKARDIFESYWTYVSADSSNMSFAVYTYMTYVYLTQKPWIAAGRSHEISMAFDAKILELGSDIWYNTAAKKIDIQNGSVKGVELEDGSYIPCKNVISILMPNVVFDRMVDEKEVPIRDRQMMNTRKLGQACFTVYVGLDADAKTLGLKNYDTFMRYDPDNRHQYAQSNSIDTHKDITCTVLTNAIPDAAGKDRAFLQLSKFYTGDPFENISEEEYFKIKDKIVKESIERYEEVTECDIQNHIEEIVIASPMTWARYLGTPKGSVYGYEPAGWDGMFPRVQSGHHEDHTIKGLRFAGCNGTQMDGYSQAYLSGAEQARYLLEEMEA